MLSNHQKGSLRDREILRTIGEQTALNTDQLKLLFFQNVNQSMAYRRLVRLVEKKYLKRDRFSANEPYFYYTEKRPGQPDHVLGVSWIYTWISLNIRSWEKLHVFDREMSYRTIRPDAFIAIRNHWEKKLSFYFAEFDVAESGNKFDKIEKYNTLYSSEGYLGAWWITLASHFPSIIIVTTGNPKRIQERIDADNKNNLDFRLYTLEQIKGECMNGRGGKASIRAK